MPTPTYILSFEITTDADPSGLLDRLIALGEELVQDLNDEEADVDPDTGEPVPIEFDDQAPCVAAKKDA
jgi:hypothetical protein